MKGLKKTKGKLPWHLIFDFFQDLEEIVRVMKHGADKYKEGNWKENVKENPLYYKNALLRHYVSYIKGEKKDKFSRLPTLAHLICCAFILMWRDRCQKK